jgi:hypothetical protein
MTQDTEENTRVPADLAQSAGQAMSAMMGADPGYLCALQPGDGHRELPCRHGRMRATGGAAQDDRRAG